MIIIEAMEEFILSLCDEIMLAYQFGFVKGLEIGIDTGKKYQKKTVNKRSSSLSNRSF